MSNFLSKFKRLAPDLLSVNFFFYCSCPLSVKVEVRLAPDFCIGKLLIGKYCVGRFFVVSIFLLLLLSTFLSKLRCVWRQIDGPGFQAPHDNQGCCNNNRDLEKEDKTMKLTLRFYSHV